MKSWNSKKKPKGSTKPKWKHKVFWYELSNRNMNNEIQYIGRNVIILSKMMEVM